MRFHNVLVVCHVVLLVSAAVAFVGEGLDGPVQTMSAPPLVIPTLPPSGVVDSRPSPFIDIGTIVISAKASALPPGPVTQRSAIKPCSRRRLLQGSGNVIECEGGQDL